MAGRPGLQGCYGGGVTDGRVWCSRSAYDTRWTERTAGVVTGPACPRHLAPMHRAPAPPREFVQWICHGYDGEGCDEYARTPVTRAA